MARAAVIALLAAIAVLAHHELSAASGGPATASAAHPMTPGMRMPAGAAAQDTALPGHRHGRTAERGARSAAIGVPAAGGADRADCCGTATQHCSTAALEVVKLRAPAQTPAPWSPAASGAVPSEPAPTGTVERAPPDLSVLSPLRI
ncbi:hypothetical protein DI272_43680 [Streptomyces sp. Act143]|nr:hypothetical protein DI272_43680 [Streptomyces sp. Act143]